ncbi:MAG: beta-ketoacyl synthase, partial [Desulfobacterales bacterium]|nr:beta-ketoacyl synthase [Desulfobacterales bacterium]
MNFQNPKIAVVSMAGIFPGAPDTDTFIANILAKQGAVVKVPGHRWAAPSQVMVSGSDTALQPDRAASDRAGLITDFQFDPSGFDMDRELLENLDPVHQLVLSAGREAVGQCRLSASVKERTGVILAAIALPTDRSSKICHDIYLEPRPAPLSRYDALGATVVSTPAGILAGAMGLRGGCFTLDAACASSLFAIKLACEHLMLNKADAMVAGGVSRPDSLYTQVGFTQLQALSPTGRCAPFDKGADGLVVGEGTGLLVLKRLEDALACGDTIHGVITGWGVSNDIEGNLVAPASEGQVRAMMKAYEMAGWSPAEIQFMECHGSGTPKGDQVEITSIKTLLNQFGCPDTPLSIGSVKSTVGHLLTAAGAAGFIKTLKAMQLKTLPPSLNFSAPPEESPIHGSRIKVQSDPGPWEAGSSPRRAGISAFGFGGINAHILVEEFLPEPVPHVVPDSLPEPEKETPLAIVGMDALSGAVKNLDDLERLIFGEVSCKPLPAAPRWRRTAHLDSQTRDTRALFIDALELDLKSFHIPPNQMPDILPQHLAMLKVAKGALTDAGIQPRPDRDAPPRHRMGCAMGIDFDFGATDFYLRWHLHDLPGNTLDQISPALSFDRTLGALGGIVASRVAREFKLGGPCFTLSAGPASGMKAVETALHSLGSGETDIFLCGAVDLAGDIRSFTVNHTLSAVDEAIWPSEGAAAIVLKRLDRAIEDQDRIYGVITGAGSASGANIDGGAGYQPQVEKSDAYSASLKQALTRSGADPANLSMITVQGHPDNPNGQSERQGIHSLTQSPAGSSVPGTGGGTPRIFCPALAFGDTGAVSGLFSIVATSLSIYHRKLPVHISDGTGDKEPFRAAVGSLTPDGASAHVILSSAKTKQPGPERVYDTKAPDLLIPVTRAPIPEDLVRMISERYPAASKDQVTQDDFTGQPEPGANLADPDLLIRTQEITARTHERFLEFSSSNLAEMGRQLAVLASADPVSAGNIQVLENQDTTGVRPAENSHEIQTADALPQKVFLSRDKCLEYAVGKAGNVLGPEFDIIDTYPVRVRLPDEPLMLVDRIMDIQGEMLSLTSGKIIT